jgi:hypothetical protein
MRIKSGSVTLGSDIRVLRSFERIGHNPNKAVIRLPGKSHSTGRAERCHVAKPEQVKPRNHGDEHSLVKPSLPDFLLSGHFSGLCDVIKALKRCCNQRKVSNLLAPRSPTPIGLLPKWAAPPVQGGTAGTVSPFRERAPWFGGDLQTLRNTVRGAPPDLPGGERLLLPMPDGDRLAARLDRRADPTARPLVVLVHGVAGSEASGYAVVSTRHLVGQGWPVLRLNLRGALPSRPTAAGHYHAGRTEDLAEALRGLPADLTRYGIVLLGYSLGGNLVLKFMGEGGHGLPVLAAVVVSTPIDLRRPVLG